MNIAIRSRLRWQKRLKEAKFYLWLLPAFILLIFFLVIPTFETILLSFQVRQKLSLAELRKEFLSLCTEISQATVTRDTPIQQIPRWEECLASIEKKYAIENSELQQIVEELPEITVQELAEASYSKLANRATRLRWGVDHYITMFTDQNMLIAFRNNILWLVFFTFFTVGFGLMFAKLIEHIRWAFVAKTLLFLPMAISYVAAAVIWSFVYEKDAQIGVLNAVFTFLTQVGSKFNFSNSYYESIAFLGRPETVNFALIAAGVWMWVGFCMTIFSAAIKNIPEEIREAAMIDGATPVQTFFLVEIPLLLPTITVVTTTMVINVLKVFDIVYTMTQGGPYGSSEVLANRMYRTAFNEGNLEYAAAMAVVLFLCIIPITIGNVKSYYIEESQRG